MCVVGLLLVENGGVLRLAEVSKVCVWWGLVENDGVLMLVEVSDVWV